jgi:hypothetical protein
VKFLGEAAKSILFASVVFCTASASPCLAQYLPSVTGTPRAPVDIPQTNLTPISQPNYGGFGAPSFPPSSGFPPSSSLPSSYTPPPYSAPVYTAPASPYPPATGYSGAPGGSVTPMGTSLFDPYSTGANPGTFAPAIPGVAPVTSPTPQFPGWLPGATPTFGPGNPGFDSPSGFGAPAFPSSAYPAGSPNTLFPGGLFGSGGSMGASGGAYNAYRLFQGPRFRYGWLADGDGSDDVEMHDIDTSLVFAFPNFLYSGQPVYVVPSFGLHLVDGPAGSTNADLPAQLYDAFLDTGWQSDPNQLIGADLGLRVGVFTDFENTSSDSLRILGKGLVTFRLTPYSTVKAGVVYLDRNRVKLLPAGGLLYTPTPLTRYDISFPQPKLSQYFTTVGTKDVWAYLAADYGGGSWAIQRDDGRKQSVDINDIRVLLGVEWGRSDLIRTGRTTGFFEVGYVFDREVIYKEARSEDIDPGSTFMLRAGFGY